MAVDGRAGTAPARTPKPLASAAADLLAERLPPASTTTSEASFSDEEEASAGVRQDEEDGEREVRDEQNLVPASPVKSQPIVRGLLGAGDCPLACRRRGLRTV
eukprot:IDg17627t1